jgi:hypothetical protein
MKKNWKVTVLILAVGIAAVVLVTKYRKKNPPPDEMVSDSAALTSEEDVNKASISLNLNRGADQQFVFANSGELVFETNTTKDVEPPATSMSWTCTMPFTASVEFSEPNSFVTSLNQVMQKVQSGAGFSNSEMSTQFTSGFFKVDGDDVVNLDEARVEDFSGTFEIKKVPSLDSTEPMTNYAAVNAKGIGFQMPLNDSFTGTAKLTLTLNLDTARKNVVCAKIMEEGFIATQPTTIKTQ